MGAAKGNKSVRSKGAAGPVVLKQPVSELPAGYGELLSDLKTRIAAARVKAALAVNRELIDLYWHIGRSIVQRQRDEGWGKAVVDRLAGDLRGAFPGVGGFSRQNIWKMRGFYLAWTEEVTILSQPVRELDGTNLPQAVAEIPWGHNTELLFKLKDPARRLWYARKTIEHGWSRSILISQIESNLYGRSGKAINNFDRTLPPPQSDLAGEILKDPYNFDFLTLADDAHERDVERGLLEHLKRFFLELGTGFAFVGQQYHLQVGGRDFYLDLLFYHLKLRAYVVIDLKHRDFEPEFAGKMNFYLSAADDLIRDARHDGPSVGLPLCKSRDRLVVEYALRDTAKPIGVAEYHTGRTLPEPMKHVLPSPEQLEAELSKVRPGGAGGGPGASADGQGGPTPESTNNR